MAARSLCINLSAKGPGFDPPLLQPTISTLRCSEQLFMLLEHLFGTQAQSSRRTVHERSVHRAQSCGWTSQYSPANRHHSVDPHASLKLDC